LAAQGECRFTLRDAQLVLAREYGFDNWAAWRNYVESSSDRLEVVFRAAQRAIRDKHPERLQEILVGTPELVRARNSSGEDLISQTLSYANFVADQAPFWTSSPCAEVLVSAGAEVTPKTCLRAMYTGDTEMVRMFLRLEAIPGNLRNAAAAGGLEQVRNLFNSDGRLKGDARPSFELHEEHEEVPAPDDDRLVIADAFRLACRCGHLKVARWLLTRALELDGDLARKIEGGDGIESFLEFFLQNRVLIDVRHNLSIWELAQVARLEVCLGEQDVDGFRRVLQAEPWLLTKKHLSLQNHLIETCAYGKGPELARTLLSLEAAIRESPPANSRALVYAIDYGDREMIELLLPYWKPREELPTWAGLGHLGKVRSFFDEQGRMRTHRAEVYPESAKVENTEAILTHALGLACMNEQLEVADFLLRRGADINRP
jgi:hypothetical protein